MVIGGHHQMGSLMDIALRNIFPEPACMGKHGDGTTYGMLLTEFPCTLGREIGDSFLYIGQLIQALLGKRTAGADGFLAFV